jgi:hypothetical protein
MVVTLNSTTRTITRVDATQRARVTMAGILNQLNSACTSEGATPVQPGSTATSLIFTYQYGNAATPTPTQDTITFNASAGTLVQSTSSGSKTLLTNVSQSANTPVFQYYAYTEPTNPSTGAAYTDSSGSAYMMLLDGTTPVPGTSYIPPAAPLSTPLSTDGAQTAVEIVMTLYVGASGVEGENTNLPDGPLTVSDSAVLRLTPAANDTGSGSSFGPCE